PQGQAGPGDRRRAAGEDLRDQQDLLGDQAKLIRPAVTSPTHRRRGRDLSRPLAVFSGYVRGPELAVLSRYSSRQPAHPGATRPHPRLPREIIRSPPRGRPESLSGGGRLLGAIRPGGSPRTGQRPERAAG